LKQASDEVGISSLLGLANPVDQCFPVYYIGIKMPDGSLLTSRSQSAGQRPETASVLTEG